MTTFTEDFTASNQELNGWNGWTVEGGNGYYEIVSNLAKYNTTSSGGGYVIRDIGEAQDFPISLTFRSKGSDYNAYTDRNITYVYLGCNSAGANGIKTQCTRSSSLYTNSQIKIFDGATEVAGKSISFQFTGEYDYELTINADGSGTLEVTDVSSGSSDSISWGARTWTNGKDDYFAFSIERSMGGGGSEIDTIDYTYGGAATAPSLPSRHIWWMFLISVLTTSSILFF